MSLTILGKNVLVELLEKKESSIILVENNNPDATLEAKVIGYGKMIEHEEIAIGKIVIFKKYTALDVNYENKKYLMLKEEDILMVKDAE